MDNRKKMLHEGVFDKWKKHQDDEVALCSAMSYPEKFTNETSFPTVTGKASEASILGGDLAPF